MAAIIRPNFSKKSKKQHKYRQNVQGEVVPLGNIDLPTVVDTIGLLRSLEDQSFLDNFNNRDYHASQQDLKQIS